jgi:Ni,Fe-hydrogenase I large subunit
VVLDLRASARAEETARVERETSAELQSTSAYQNKLNEIVDSKLDVQRELIKIFSVLEARIEHFYNLLQTHQFPNSREERVFQGYIDQLIKLLDSYKKYVEGYNDSIEHNININVMNNQIDLVRDSVRAALEEVSPELSIKFMGILSRNMRALESGQEGTIIAETVSHVKH